MGGRASRVGGSEAVAAVGRAEGGVGVRTDDSSRALDGLNAVMIRKVLEDVTCDSELCLGEC